MKVSRQEPVDLLVRDAETAVLLADGIVRLSELSAVLYALAEEPVKVEDLARSLETHFGAPADRTSLRATTDAVREIIPGGLLIET